MAQRLYDITPLEPLIREGYTLLTPNHRLARRIKAEWDARQTAAGKLTWESVPVLPLEAWLQQQWAQAASESQVPPLTPLAPAQTLELWRQVIGQHELQTAEFLLLRPSAAADLASRARDTLLRWQVDVRASAIRSQFELEADCRTFLQWLHLFEARLVDARQCTLTDCAVHLADLGGHRPAARVALVAFDELAPLLRAVLKTLCSEVLHVFPSAQAADCRVHAFTDKRSELQSIAAWAADLQRTAPATTIGIVLSNMTGERVSLEYLLRREFGCLGGDYASLPVNFSTGIPLAQVPLVRDALAVLAMGLRQTTMPAVEALLRSRFLTMPDAQSALAQYFVRQLYAQGRADVPIADLRNDATRVSLGDAKGLLLGEYLSALRDKHEFRRKASPSIWARHFSEILSGWGWPGAQALDSVEYQQLVLWHRTLEEFAMFDIVCKPFHFDEALALLRDFCKRQMSQPQTADSPVQVLGPLEAAGLSFDHLWISGMQSADWPASPRPNPFMPITMQTRLQMPHASPEREWAFADALVKQYARTSHILHASYCRQIDGVPAQPSALLQDFMVEAVPQPTAVSAQWLTYQAQGTTEQFNDHSGPRFDAGQQSTMRGGSSLLEDQSQCPFRAFARHRLRVEPLAAMHVSLSAGERGSLLHDALNVLWGELCDYATLLALDNIQQEQTVRRAVQAAIANVPYQQQRKPGAAYWRLEETRLVALLHEWLHIERQRSSFVVVARERDLTLEIAQLPLRLRVDRIDQLADGSRLIIDYKSSPCSVKDWFGDRPAQPQLPLYSTAEQERVTGMAFAVLRSRESRFVGLGRVAAAPGISSDFSRVVKAGINAQEWSELAEYWRSTLECLVQSFLAGDAQVDPLTAASCTWCGLQPLCRIGDQVDQRPAVEQDEAV